MSEPLSKMLAILSGQAPTADTCICGKPGAPMHTCPFQEAINGDSESVCNCCADCEERCCEDI